MRITIYILISVWMSYSKLAVGQGFEPPGPGPRGHGLLYYIALPLRGYSLGCGRDYPGRVACEDRRLRRGSQRGRRKTRKERPQKPVGVGRLTQEWLTVSNIAERSSKRRLLFSTPRRAAVTWTTTVSLGCWEQQLAGSALRR